MYSRLLLIALLLIPQLTLAQSISITPSRDYPLNTEFQPGDSHTATYIAKNGSDTTAKLVFEITDGFQNKEGSLLATPGSSLQTNVGLWSSIEESTIELEANETREIEYTISVPVDTQPGSYIGAMTVTQLPRSGAPKDAGVGAKVTFRLAQIFFVNIAGEKKVIYDWNNFSYQKNKKGHLFEIGLQNQGNTIINVDGEIIIDDGKTQNTIPLPKTQLIQNTNISIPIAWGQKPFYGFFDVKANINFYEYDIKEKAATLLETQSRSLQFQVIPWTFIIVCISLIILILISIILIKKHNKKVLATATKYSVKQGDTLEILAQQKKVSWKKIAKLNKIKAPYTINAGQTILIPKK